MTPKEKAQELFDKFYSAIPNDEMGKNYESAKQCALILINELMREDWYYEEYWLKIKKEIKKL